MTTLACPCSRLIRQDGDEAGLADPSGPTHHDHARQPVPKAADCGHRRIQFCVPADEPVAGEPHPVGHDYFQLDQRAMGQLWTLCLAVRPIRRRQS